MLRATPVETVIIFVKINVKNPKNNTVIPKEFSLDIFEILLNNFHKAQATRPVSMRGKTEQRGFTKRGSRTPLGLIAA